MKVIILKLFSGQLIFRVTEEPVSICIGPNNTVLVATRSGWIEQHQVLEEAGRTQLLHKFGPISKFVVRIALLDDGHVVVLEREAERAGKLHVYAVGGALACTLASEVEEFAVCDERSLRLLVANANHMELLQFDADHCTFTSLCEIAVCHSRKLALSGRHVAYCSRDRYQLHVMELVVARVPEAMVEDDDDAVVGADNGDDANAVVEYAAPERLCCNGVGLPLLLPALADQKPYAVTGPKDNFEASVTASDGHCVESNRTLLAQNVARADGPIHSVQVSQGRLLVALADEAWLYALDAAVVATLAHYNFTAATLSAVMDATYLYAVQSGNSSAAACLEAYTLRPNLRSVVPHIDVPPPCLVSSVPFIGLQSVVSLGRGLALMSKQVAGADAFWSVSMLVPERPMDVWRELVVKAGPTDDVYLLLHLEGLFLLRASADEHALDCCRIVGDYFETTRDFAAAAAFWGMGNVPVDEVTRRLLHQRQAAGALADFIVQALERGDPRLASVGVGIGNSLLEHLAKHRPGAVPHAILTCSMAHDPSLATGLLVRVGSDVERFARAYCYSQVGDEGAAAVGIKSVGADRVAALLQQYPLCWLRDGALTPFGQCVLSVSGLSLLEVLKGRSMELAEALLGAHHLPYFIMFLERVVVDHDTRHRHQRRNVFSVTLNTSAPTARGDFKLAIPRLARAYIARCSSADTIDFPFGSVDGRFLVDLEETPVETRWMVRHWHWMCSARLPWMRPTPRFYAAKLQGLLIMVRQYAPKLAFELHRDADTLPREVVDACALLWSPPFTPSFFALSHDVVVGYTKEFCETLREWQMALEAVRLHPAPAAYAELLSHCIEQFSARDFVRLLPQSEPLAAYIPILMEKISRDASERLLLDIGRYAENGAK